MPCGIVCGFSAEQRIAARAGKLTTIGWKRPEAAARDLVARGATSLLSFGLAGALDPGLATGDILLPVSVSMVDGSRLDISADFRKLFESLFPEARPEPLHAGEAVIATAAEKHRLFSLTGAVAVDMESAGVARAAIALGVPFAVFRVVGDEAGDTLPLAALEALDDAGNVRPGHVLRSLLHNPAQLLALLHMARQSRKAMRVLESSSALFEQSLR